MLRSRKTISHPIGLDLGHDTVRLLQLDEDNDALKVHASASQLLPMAIRAATSADHIPAALDFVRHLVRQGRFRGLDVVAAIPRGIVHVKNLRLPLIPAAELRAAIRFEAREIFPFDTEAAQIEFLPAGEVRQGSDVRQEVIVLAVKNEDADRFVEQLHCAGLVPVSLDLEPIALFRTIERFICRKEDEFEATMLVDIGARRSQVVIGKGREITFLKSVEIGGDQLHEAVSRKLGITIDEARALRRRLAIKTDSAVRRDPVRQAVCDATRSTMEELGRELSLCLRYYSVTFRGHRPTKVRLTGGEAYDPQLQAVLNASLSVPVEAGRPLASVETSAMKSGSAAGLNSEWALALGLALRKTAGRFAALDGKARDANVPYPTSIAELVNLNIEIPPPGPDAPIEKVPGSELIETSHGSVEPRSSQALEISRA